MKIELSKKLKEKPVDESKIGFGNIYTDHMLIMEYKDGAWDDGKIVPYGNISLDPCAMCFHYGQTIFEGLKAYRTEDDRILLFRPEENFKRMNLSCERLCIPKIDEKKCLEALIELIKIEKDWVPKSQEASLYIRPFIIATQPNLGVCPSSSYYLIIVLSPSGAYYKDGLKPVDIYVETDYVRAVRGGVGMAKCGGNYAASLKSQVKAYDGGFSQSLWLDGVDRKYIEEVGAMNIFFVLEGEIVTPEINGSILDGITRKSVIEILKRNGYNVRERLISIDEISDSYDMNRVKEIFGTGTAAVISPVGSLKWNDKLMDVGRDKCGDISKFLYDTLTGIQRGKVSGYDDWIMEVK